MLAQAPALLPNKQLLEIYTRAVQLMEAAAFSTPELSRAGAPLLENARQALGTLRLTPDSAALNETFLTNLHGYLTLSDLVPKPYPFPAQARDQLVELRNIMNQADANFRLLLAAKDREVRSSDPAELDRYATDNARMNPPLPGKPRVVFYGDSITDAWRLNEYYPDRDFINRGISGQTTFQMLARFKADVIRLKPDAVIILAGTNDISRGIALPAIEDNLSMMAALADANHIKVLLSTVLPVNDVHKKDDPTFERTRLRPTSAIHQLNVWIESFCSEKSYAFVNYFSEMSDASGLLKPDLADDGLHPNSTGYRIMAPVALAAIDRAIAISPQQKPRRRRLISQVGK
jgi:lysophospholipase L1-like esterase